MPLVSVLMPCYNHSAYVEEALESIAASDYPSLELIVIDDGSSDDTFALAENWATQHSARFFRIECIQHTGNRGISRTLNELVKLAQGAFFCFIASDDRLIADGIGKQVRCALHHQVDFVFADSTLIDPSGATLAESAIRYFGRNIAHMQHRRCLVTDVLLNWEAPWTRIFASARLFHRLGSFDENLKFEDRDFMLRTLLDGSFAFLPEPVYTYRIRIGNRLTPGLESERMWQDFRRAESKAFHQASGFIWLLLGINVYSGKTYFDKNSVEHRSLLWPAFTLLRRALRTLHMGRMNAFRRRHIPHQPPRSEVSSAEAS